MVGRRNLAVWVLWLAPLAATQAQTYRLIEKPQAGDYNRYRLDMNLVGEIRVARDGEIVPLQLTATANHEFPERILAVDDRGLPCKVARHYDKARAVITVNGIRNERSVRSKRRLMVAQQAQDLTLLYCPLGPLTRDELMTCEHLDTLPLTGLLPGKEVVAGATWKVPNTVVQALCRFEGLTLQDLTCKLEKVHGDSAEISVRGPAQGIELGALVKMEINATLRFDLKQSRIVALEWKQKDERDQGPASPTLTVEATVQLTRAPIEPVAALSDVALVSVPDGMELPSHFAALLHQDSEKRYDVVYSRDWHIVAATHEYLVMRLLERGDFIAQVTVTPWSKAKAGTHLSEEEFHQAVSMTPGWEEEQVLQSGEVPMEGKWCCRISSIGTLDELNVVQNFYLIASPTGEQVVVTFTMKQAQVDKLGTRDLSFVGSLEIPSKAKDVD